MGKEGNKNIGYLSVAISLNLGYIFPIAGLLPFVARQKREFYEN